MKENLTEIDKWICHFQARFFEKSLDEKKYSSPIFIRRFMLSNIATWFDNKSIMVLPDYFDSLFEDLDEEYGSSSYGKENYSRDEMFWIGYIYRTISLVYNLSSRAVYHFFSAREIVKFYNTYHTFDPVYAAIRMMEVIGYKEEDNTEKGLKILRELTNKEKTN